MSQCPFANFPNLIDPETYVNGMPYETLAKIRASGPVHYMDGSYLGVPYWLITGRDEIDFVSKHPKQFSSEARSKNRDGSGCPFRLFRPTENRLSAAGLA